MAARPENKESLRSVADQVVWAIMTYGCPRGAMLTPRPQNVSAIRSVAEQAVWAMTS
jgi:hypothetical protein